MNFKEIRKESIQRIQSFGLPIPNLLPLIELPDSKKDEPEILDRLLCLHALAAVAYGFDRSKAQAWIIAEGIQNQLTDRESQFIYSGNGSKTQYMLQIEGMWALAWTLQIIEKIEFDVLCNETFARIMPNLKMGESSNNIRGRAKVRALNEVASILDLAYCMHWGINQCRIMNIACPENILPDLVIERRRALEWVWGNDSWDLTSLDT